MDPATLMAIIGASGQLLSTWKGHRDASKQNQKSQQLINSNLKQAETERKIAGNNYLDTLEGKALATQALEALREATTGASNSSIKSGETTAQRLARQSQAQQSYSNIIQQLAMRSTQYRQNADALLNSARRDYTKAQTDLNTAAAKSDVNSGEGVAKAIGNLTNAGIQVVGNKAGSETGTETGTNTVPSIKKSADVENVYKQKQQLAGTTPQKADIQKPGRMNFHLTDTDKYPYYNLLTQYQRMKNYAKGR